MAFTCFVKYHKWKAYKASATMQAIKAGFKINAGPLARGKLKSPRTN